MGWREIERCREEREQKNDTFVYAIQVRFIQLCLKPNDGVISVSSQHLLHDLPSPVHYTFEHYYSLPPLAAWQHLNQQVLDLNLHLVDGTLQLTGLVGGDARGDDGTGDSAGAAEGDLGGDEDVGDVLVFAEEGQVEEDLEGLGVGGHNDHLGEGRGRGEVLDSREMVAKWLRGNKRLRATHRSPQKFPCSGSWWPRWRPS